MKKYIFIALLLISSNISYARTYTNDELKKSPAIVELLLLEALDRENIHLSETLLSFYSKIPNRNLALIKNAKIKIAQFQFKNYHNKESLHYFQTLKSDFVFPKSDLEIIDHYLSILHDRNSWQFTFNAHYLQTKNVNNTAETRQIEDTGFVKNTDMLPKSAKGFAYYATATRNWQIKGSHFIHFSNDLSGKSYWNNHDYDELINRTYVGYLYQHSQIQWAVKPFYERQWYGDHRYNWAKGIRAELVKPFAENWQISTALEWGAQRYFKQDEKNGTTKLISATLFWQPSTKGYIYLGTDFIGEKTKEKQYSNDIKSLRLGLQHSFGWEIKANLSTSFSLRQFKDEAVLGGILPLGKTRRDKIYTASLTLWKSDWNWKGFTPKLQFKWKKQDSNIPSMFSYSDKYTQIAIEKSF